MALVHEKTATLEIDDKRSITVTPIDTGGATIAMDDPHSIAVVEVTAGEIDALIEILQQVNRV